MSDRETFEVTKDDKTIKLAVITPNAEISNKAQREYNRAFRNALDSGAIFRETLEVHMRKQGLWDDKKAEEHEKLVNKIRDGERRLAQGGIKLSEGKQIALDMARNRGELQSLLAQRNRMDVNTADGQAENARFNALVSLCIVDAETNKPYYKDLDDYLNHSSDPEARQGAEKLANMIYDIDEDYEKNLPENKFLRQYNFVDDSLRLVNKDGQLVDVDGNLVDENGRYIDENGNYIDRDGNRVDENGEYVVDSQPFLDDDGNPV
jgi:hypothetical protein